MNNTDERLVPTSMALTRSQFDAVKDLASRLGISRSTWFRAIVDAALRAEMEI